MYVCICIQCIPQFGTLTQKHTLAVTSLCSSSPSKKLTSLLAAVPLYMACSQVQHENLVRFYGVCIDSPPLRIVTEFCHLDSRLA